MRQDTKSRYGQWAVVAGASEGLGAAFAETLAARGHDLVLLARRASLLESLANELGARHKVTVRTLACDLSDERLSETLRVATRDLEVGVAIYNAAYSYMGPMLERPLEDALRTVDVNVRGPLKFLHAIGPGMIERRRGGIVLMSSLAGFQGLPSLATYAASKAYNIVLGEALWAELKPRGVDVVVSCAGAIRTPGYMRTVKREAPGILDAAAVAEASLQALGRGPLVVPGAVNKMATFLMRRLMPVSSAVGIMGRSTEGVARPP